MSAFYRSSSQFKNQISILNGKKAGSDINLYKLFLEQSFNLLREGGRCGIITAGGVYTDLGTKQLREMLFSECELDTLFGLSNERFIFENVHHAQKFCLVVFEKGGSSQFLKVAFRINPREAVGPNDLDQFLNSDIEHLKIPVGLIRRLSPDSLSIMEFKNNRDVQISEKMAQFPLLGHSTPESPGIQFAREFDMTQTGGSKLVTNDPKPGYFPLYEGKMIWQFDHQLTSPNFWVNPKALRTFLLGKHGLETTPISADSYRLVLRRQSASTNERTLITTIIPPGFHADNLASVLVFDENGKRLMQNSQQIFLCAVLNSFVADFSIRQRVTNNLNFFFLYQLPAPRLADSEPECKRIVDRAARLICTTDEFDALAKEVGLSGYKAAAANAAERFRLRAELEGLVAQLYGLTEEEFSYVLTTFPLIDASLKEAVLEAYRGFAPKSVDQQVVALIKSGENSTVEFKSSARWDIRENKLNKALEQVIVKTVAGFLNSNTGGTLIIGVDDAGQVAGLGQDYKTLGKKQDRDGYENWLTTLLLDQFGKESSSFLQISFHSMGAVEVCQVSIKPSPKPAYVKDLNAENLFVRTGNSTRQLTTREAVEYCKHRWKI